MTITTRSRFWGPLFPDVWDVPGRTFWGPLFPDPGPELDTVPPSGPSGVATFVLDLDGPLDLTLEYQTDVFKAYDGTETRAAVLEHPRRRFSGSALLIGGTSVRTLRTQLHRHAATGAAFLLGLPFEAMLIADDAAGKSLTVAAGALASCDWANPGQRVVVVAPNRTAVNAVVQSAAGAQIVLNVAPGAVGVSGGRVMPAIATYLEPQQGFARYRNPDGFERWSIDARAALFGYQKSPVAAILDLESVASPGNNLTGLFVQARTPGIAGNDIRIAMDDQSLAGIDIVEVGTDITIHFEPGVSTVADLAAAINANSSLVKAIGAWNGAFTLTSGVDEFALAGLDGGSDGSYAADGTGAVLSMHAGRPVFDRSPVVEDTAGESLQSATEVIDLGGIPENVGQATTPDWGRHVAMLAPQGSEWQWLKRFLATTFDRQRTFWLPTWRRDLTAVATGVNTLTIDVDGDADGGFFTWYPRRADLQIVQADGTITRVTVSNAVDNGDGTATVTIGVTLSASPITMVSWLELCRFEDDAIQVRFANHIFSMQTTARAVTQ